LHLFVRKVGGREWGARMSRGLMDAKVGDSLILTTSDRRRPDTAVTVTRIGRKYLYVSYGPSSRESRTAYHRATGSGNTAYGSADVLFTQAQYDERKRRAALFRDLHDRGVEVRFNARPDFTTDVLAQILALCPAKEIG
jgi:hypothetical protein